MIAISTTSLATAGCLTGSFIVSAQHHGNITFVAHRGLCSKAYQNSEDAFQLAAANPNVGGIETDV
jgi:glycerophosphoryl diester phosphodiesterase